ncbi:LANO_0H02696g1_1 [Lachancea nothofagi CBS 11611]|uniref:LANO_0H02696g1_1 n=1 Tax=Lachancea nothofagi CBS 11611 TaxID=1266666 RepID=A0A1G4KKX3_9SACH|nr:LANO_0H02696g1_1 [Lachancea nothofagi CBS 11611]
MDYSQVFKNLQSILQAASSKCKVIDEKFPSKFFEKEPSKIFESYKKFLKPKLDSDGIIKNEDNFLITTIAERFEKGEYLKKQDGFYRLHHDVKLVCTLLIHFYPQGTRTYQMVDKFYKFATELLLRECYRCGISLTDESDDQYGFEKTAFQKQISNDFIKISTAYSVPYAESYYLSSGDLDLFSSTTSKSQLDHRSTEAPNSSFVLNKVIPQTGDDVAPKLGFLAANVSNIPDPTLPPYEMLTKFLHPNWYALPTTVWLEYGDFKSWAPCFNESGTVIDAGRRGTIWLEKIGYTRLRNLRDSQINGKDGEHTESQNRPSSETQTPTEPIIEVTSNPAPEVIGDEKAESISSEPSQNGHKLENGEKNAPYLDPATNPAESEGAAAEAVITEIKLENLYDWAPGNTIEDDEIKAASDGAHQKLITQTLLEMITLKKDRIRSKRVSKPSTREVQLYHKVQRLMREVMLAKQMNKIPQITARSFPVLQANYTGSIPVVRTVQARKKKYKK